MAELERGQRWTPAWLAWCRGGQIDLSATLARMPATDLDAAACMREEYGSLICYSAPESAWHIWDGRCRGLDRSEMAAKLITDFANRYEVMLSICQQQVRAQVASRLPEAEGRELAKAITEAWAPWAEGPAKYARGLRKTAGWRSLLQTLAVASAVDPGVLEPAEHTLGWLNTANGTVDLRTSLIKPHDPADGLTYCLDTPYDPAAACPQFWQLLWHVAGRDDQVARFLWKALGYTLLGDNPEQLIFCIQGPTASGKSQLLQAVCKVLGQLGHNSQVQLVTVSRAERNARVENSIRGKRMVAITETGERMAIDEAQVKRLTGESWVSVHQHYAKTEIPTRRTWTIWLATNQMPVLVNFDEAMRRRLIVIPGGETIPPEHRVPGLAEKIAAAEAPGILAALIAGAAAYHAEGLVPPLAVQMKTDAYAAEQNTVANFVADCCMLMSQGMNGDRPWTGRTAAWEAYRDWSRGALRLGRNEFYQQLAQQPGVFYNQVSRRFEGIQLIPGLTGAYQE